MKHFIAALAVLALTFCAVTANGIYVRRATEKLCAEAEKLLEANADQTEKALAFEREWESVHGMLSISIHECRLERVCDAVAELKGAAFSDDREGYTEAAHRLAAVLSELADGEKCGFFNIF